MNYLTFGWEMNYKLDPAKEMAHMLFNDTADPPRVYFHWSLSHSKCS